MAECVHFKRTDGPVRLSKAVVALRENTNVGVTSTSLSSAQEQWTEGELRITLRELPRVVEFQPTGSHAA